MLPIYPIVIAVAFTISLAVGSCTYIRARLKATAKRDIEMQALPPVPAPQPQQPITMQDNTTPSTDTSAKPQTDTGFNFGPLNNPLPAIREERYVLGGAPAAGGRFLSIPASAHTRRSPVTDARMGESGPYGMEGSEGEGMAEGDLGAVGMGYGKIEEEPTLRRGTKKEGGSWKCVSTFGSPPKKSVSSFGTPTKEDREKERRERARSEASAKLEGTWEGYAEQEDGELDYGKLAIELGGK